MGIRTTLRTMLPPALAEPLRAWVVGRRDRAALAAYRRRPEVPPPHALKAATVIEHGRRHGLAILIETGTFEGEMARKCAPHFRAVYTIELDPGLAARAALRLARHRNVRVIQGDSAARLPELLAGIAEPALFWLDGHYSGTGTACAGRETPLLEELDAIARHGVRGHVVLIDDARWLGRGDYPDLGTLAARVRAIDPGYEVTVADDIVRCRPGAGAAAPAGGR